MSARERAEAALHHSEERYRDIFNAAGDAMVLRDENYRVVDVNAAFVALTGFSREEALGKDRVIGGAPTESHAAILARHRKVLAGEPVVVETRRMRKDGTSIDVELRCVPVQHQGRPHVLYTARDIGDRKRAEEALRTSEEQYRSIFNAAQDSMVLRDADFRIVDVNAAYMAVSGFSREEALGQDRVLGNDPPEFEQLLKARHPRVLAGEPIVLETERTRRDGRRIDLEVRAVPVQHRGKPHVLYIGRDISERKRAEEALRASEEQYRSIFNAAQDSMVLRDADFRIVDVNAAYVSLTGYSREEVVGKARITTSPPEKEAEIRSLHRRALAGEPVLIEVQHRRKDGTPLELELRAVPAQHHGKAHVLYIGRDIGERKRAEEALRASEEQYREIFNASADGMILRDAEFRVVDVNPAYVRLSGYSREDVIGKDRLIANPPEMSDTIRALHRRALAGEPVHLETQSVNKDGSRFELELRGVPIQYRGRPHVLYIGRDITARKRAEEVLRSSEEQYRAVFNATTEALVLRDTEARVVDVNPAFLAMSGFTRDEVVGQVRWFFAGPEMSGLAKEMHARVCAGESVHFEIFGYRKDGSRLDVEMHAVPMRYCGKPHALGMARDITARKRADAERAQLEAQLRQAQKMEAIGHLAGGIAHDFNNILTSIQGYARLAAEMPVAAANPKLASHLDHVELACNRARALIQQLLVFSRGRRGAARPVALAPLVRQAIRLLRSSLPATLEIVPDLAADLPAALLDPVQAEQVLMNLCINAHDAMHGRGTVQVGVKHGHFQGTVCASCRGAVAGEFVELSVADAGPGRRARGDGAHLRAVLQHQGDRAGHRHGARHRARHRARARRPHPRRFEPGRGALPGAVPRGDRRRSRGSGARPPRRRAAAGVARARAAGRRRAHGGGLRARAPAGMGAAGDGVHQRHRGARGVRARASGLRPAAHRLHHAAHDRARPGAGAARHPARAAGDPLLRVHRRHPRAAARTRGGGAGAEADRPRGAARRAHQAPLERRMRIERLVPCPPKELWRALIRHAELAERGAVIRLALPGGLSEAAGKITAYESEKVLECAWSGGVLRWELAARDGMTLLVFTHEPDAAQWNACLDSITARVGT